MAQLGLNPFYELIGSALTGGGGGGGGSRPTPQRPGGATSISPAFQQQFTPQFAPVLQQQQDSPGGRQAGAPTMSAPGGQTAETGAPGTPRLPGGAAPSAYPAAGPDVGRPGDFVGPVIGKEPDRGMSDIMIAGIAAVTILGGIMLWQGGKKPKAKKGKG